jgi:hypothetical protein
MPQQSPTSSPTGSHLSRLLIVPALLAVTFLLVACGGSTKANGTADEQASQQKSEAKLADFARCMREHGIEAEIAPGGGNEGVRVKGTGGPAQMEAAQKACARYQPQAKHVNLSPQQKVEDEEATQKFAKCMREHGIHVEVSTSGGGIAIRIHAHAGSEGEPNPESPGFQKAQTNCQKLLPNGGPGPGGVTKSPGGKGTETESASSSGKSNESVIAGGN